MVACLVPSAPLGALQIIKQNLFHLLTVLLWDLYFHGLGFWRGQTPADICAQLTGIEAAHWRAHPLQCDARLQAQFQGFVVGFGTPLLLYLLYRATCGLSWYIFVFQPMLETQRQARGGTSSPTRVLLLRLIRHLTPRRAAHRNVDDSECKQGETATRIMDGIN